MINFFIKVLQKFLGEIVIMVGDYISENPGITDEERAILRRAINEKSQSERIRRMNQQKQMEKKSPIGPYSRNSISPASNIRSKRLLIEPYFEESLKRSKLIDYEKTPESVTINEGIPFKEGDDLLGRHRTISMNSNKSNNSNDSTTAQQISFKDLTQENDNSAFIQESIQAKSQTPTPTIDVNQNLQEMAVQKVISPPLPMGSPPPPPPPSQIPTTSIVTTRTTTNTNLSMPFAIPPPEAVSFYF